MPNRSPRIRARVALPLLATLAISGCIHTFWKTVVTPVDRRVGLAGPVTIRTPVKVHLVDGSTIVFRTGANVDDKRLSGTGDRYALLSGVSTPVNSVALDSVVGVETFEGKKLVAKSIVVSTAATVVGAVATVALLKAIFGSCPTVYADTGAGLALQAEGFSYAIAPLLEQRDVDPLHVKPDADGVVRLELRNEALETHFINHIELLAVSHPAGARVIPDQSNRLVAVGGVRAFASARDRSGRDVSANLNAADGSLFASTPAAIAAARAGDLDDWIELDAGELPPGDSIAVVLRLRNSLLNTVLLYDGLLGGRDAPDWIETGLQHISTAIDLSAWYTRTMGLRATVGGVTTPAGQAYHARLGDVGPLAFRDVALVLPRPRGTSRIRLDFVADNWRIDQASVATLVARPKPVAVALHRVVVPNPASGGGPTADTAAAGALRESDGRYLETQPGQRMTLEFRAPDRAHSNESTTYLIAWQGYYREWIRGSWLAQPTRAEPWKPGDEAVLTALRRWRDRQADLEHAFYSSRIPVK